MSWDRKQNGKLYLYRSIRDGTRVRKKYFGNGLPSKMIAGRMALWKAERKVRAEAWRAAVARWDAATELTGQLLAGVNLVVSGTLLGAGFHGRAGIVGGDEIMSDEKQESKAIVEPDAIQKLRSLLEQARAGNEAVLPELREAMDGHPEIWKHFGVLSNHVEGAWIGLIAGCDLCVREAMVRRAEAMRGELEKGIILPP